MEKKTLILLGWCLQESR